MEGSNVTLICDFRGFKYPHSPTWFYGNGSTASSTPGRESCTSSIDDEGVVSGDCHVRRKSRNNHQLNSANTNFKNEKKLNEIVKISEQPTKGLTQILHYDKIHLLNSFFCLIKM